MKVPPPPPSSSSAGRLQQLTAARAKDRRQVIRSTSRERAGRMLPPTILTAAMSSLPTFGHCRASCRCLLQGLSSRRRLCLQNPQEYLDRSSRSKTEGTDAGNYWQSCCS
uniref:Uncharacterized protein n=1 Tax=Triticum urartu TaxID=4572 RepID=A0A8R7V2T6_TRIUA